ncbi:MAG: tetratricopeptide repeat protein [Gammaproteobacteria bacterium]
MVDYANEQEQVEAIKKWLRENGVPILVGLALGIGAIGGWRYWQAQERTRNELASALFTRAVTASRAQQPSQAEKAAQQIISDYGGTTYASFAALMLAKLAVEKQDLPAAIQHLSWVLEHSDDEGLKRLAKIRLARVALAQGKPEEAWAQLEPLAASPASAALAELRGDILLAQGKREEAGERYLEAFANSEPDHQSDETSSLAVKLDSLGITPPPPRAATVINP